MSKADNPPPGQCIQCWRHAYDRSAHAHLGPREDCQACIACARNGHRGLIVPKQRKGWW